MLQMLTPLQSELLLAGIVGVNVLILLALISMWVKISRTRKLMNKLFSGTSKDNLEEQLRLLLAQMEEWKKQQNDQQFMINRLSQRVAGQCGNLSITRYNAFGDIGSDLSFSMALLDDEQNGVVLTSIYGREESRLYAKPVQAGKSLYHLSEEEHAVVKKASVSANPSRQL
ncbi:DUF4446 family protein [Brevibacillus fluminis]|uniref:DUF4446 family protein n=1 Tax=Brevibacillus fluminis TaxID=511487 RepID=UPI003F8BC97A